MFINEDIGFVADAVIWQKWILFNEDYTSWTECRLIAQLIQKRFEESTGNELVFSTEIRNKQYFNFYHDLIRKKTKYLQTPPMLTFTSSPEIADFIYDSDFLCKCLLNIYRERISVLMLHSCETCLRRNTCEDYQADSLDCPKWVSNVSID